MGKAELVKLIKILGIRAERLVNPSSLEDRLRLQKAVFLLKHLNVEPFTNYSFSFYLRGPYSPDLASEYYDLKDVKPAPVEMSEEVSELLRWFVSHPADWLEVASSIISIKERYPEMNSREVYSLLRLSKPWVGQSFFKRVKNELKERGLPR